MSGWGVAVWDQLQIFDAESKSAKILYSLCSKLCWKFSKIFDKKCAILNCPGQLQMVPVHYVYAGSQKEFVD